MDMIISELHLVTLKFFMHTDAERNYAAKAAPSGA